jgi:hypothetical protein
VLESFLRQLRGEPDTTPDRCPSCSQPLGPSLICQQCGHDAGWDTWEKFLKAFKYLPEKERAKIRRHLKPEERAHVDAILREQFSHSLQDADDQPEPPTEPESERRTTIELEGEPQLQSEKPRSESWRVSDPAAASYRRFTFGGEPEELQGADEPRREGSSSLETEPAARAWKDVPWGATRRQESRPHEPLEDSDPRGQSEPSLEPPREADPGRSLLRPLPGVEPPIGPESDTPFLSELEAEPEVDTRSLLGLDSTTDEDDRIEDSPVKKCPYCAKTLQGELITCPH